MIIFMVLKGKWMQAVLVDRGNLDQKKVVSLEKRELTWAYRVKKSLIFGTATILLTSGFAFIPFLHFFLVPACLIGGGILTSNSFLQKSVYKLGNHSHCPSCEKEIQVDNISAIPWSGNCPSCLRQLRLESNNA